MVESLLGHTRVAESEVLVQQQLAVGIPLVRPLVPVSLRAVRTTTRGGEGGGGGGMHELTGGRVVKWWVARSTASACLSWFTLVKS